MNEITQQITEAIKQNLPQQMGEILQAELLELSNFRKDSEALKGQVLSAGKAAKKDADTIAELRQKLEQHSALAVREASVLVREQTQALRDLEVKLSNARREEMLGLVGMVFKSPVYRSHVEGTMPVPIEGMPPSQYGAGSGGMVGTGMVNTTKTTEVR